MLKIKFKFSLNFSVYVFIGEFFALIDFVRVLQNKKLLETGEYAVISVDDEIYDGAIGRCKD